ncbi:unnamed protein product [Closterium sp. Yama58-4]|nr:unnamed protein product [Closterium sp. Yama58-4]
MPCPASPALIPPECPFVCRLLGRVAMTGGYRLLCEPVKSRTIRGVGRLHLDGSKDEEQPEEWDMQFAAGVKVIALIGVPQGVLQIAACTPIKPTNEMIAKLRTKFDELRKPPRVNPIPNLQATLPNQSLLPNQSTPSPNTTSVNPGGGGFGSSAGALQRENWEAGNGIGMSGPSGPRSEVGLGFAGKVLGERGKDECGGGGGDGSGGGGGDDDAAEEGTGEWRPGENVGDSNDGGGVVWGVERGRGACEGGPGQDVYELSSGPGGTDMSVCGGEVDAGEGGAASGATGGGGGVTGDASTVCGSGGVVAAGQGAEGRAGAAVTARRPAAALAGALAGPSRTLHSLHASSSPPSASPSSASPPHALPHTPPHASAHAPPLPPTHGSAHPLPPSHSRALPAAPLPRPASRFFPKSASLPGHLPRPPPPAVAAASGGGGGGGVGGERIAASPLGVQDGLDVLVEGGGGSDFQMAAPDDVEGLMGPGIGMGGEEELGEEWAMFLDVMDAPPILDDLDEVMGSTIA